MGSGSSDVLVGESAGIKSATLVFSGENAYGIYESGAWRPPPGAHFPPFDSNKRRHTSFASVDVIAEIEETSSEITIPPNELNVDTFRSGAKGAKTSTRSKPRPHHSHTDRPRGSLPKSALAASERATAMKLLLSKIYAQRQDAQKAEMERFYGEKGSISWGNQIRSYVFQPYRMVKDLRTGVETSNVQAVMDGELDPFVNGWLRAGCPTKRMQGVKDVEE